TINQYLILSQLFAMIEMKPPISRAKMMSVTKSAIKAIKLYKHVVQIVEKFIKKCKPELKVPGLYVVDSIVRQSRHQFGVEKDVFGPRFLKNFTDTFRNLYCCPEDDKNKIIRVLNLWQKNGVFDMEILQPLMEMANGTVVPHSAAEGNEVLKHCNTHKFPVDLQPETLTGNASDIPSVLPTPEALAAVAQLFQSSHAQEQLQRMLQNFQQAERTVGTSTIANNITNQHQMPVTQPYPRTDTVKKGSLAEQKLLDRFDYDDEPEDMAMSEGNIQTHILLPVILSHSVLLGVVLFEIHISKIVPKEMPSLIKSESNYSNSWGGNKDSSHCNVWLLPDYPNRSLMMPSELFCQRATINKASLQLANQTVHLACNSEPAYPTERRREWKNLYKPYMSWDMYVQDKCTKPGKMSTDLKSVESSSNSAYKSPRRRRSRSSSRSRWSRHRRSRSREHRWRSRTSSEDQSDREKDRERRQKGLPSLKSQTLSVCSTTLWVGQLDKKTQQSDVMSLLEEFGQIESINMIPPRGCAYIVMVHRQDAYMALKKLSKGSYKANQKPTKIAWALNKGIKSAHKKFWDVEQGVTYIPWSKVKVEELESYQEGGMLDPETLNPEWNNAKEIKGQAAVNGAMDIVPDVAVSAHVQVSLKCGPDTVHQRILSLRFVFQMPTVPQCEPIGSPPAFPGPIMLSPASLPPSGAPFLHAEFDAAHQVGGKLYSYILCCLGLSILLPLDTLVIYICCYSVNLLSTFVLSAYIDNYTGNFEAPVESTEGPTGGKDPSSADNQLGSPAGQVMMLPNPAAMHGPPRPGMHGPPIPGMHGPPTPGMQGPPRMGMQGPPRPGMPPLQPPLGMPNPHMPPFPGPPNMHRMPTQMMPGGPMFPPDRFRMPMPFPPRGPPFQRHPSMGPGIRPGFGRPP
uniref:SR-related CTD-associated factor 4b n=1 Tax=Poecilia formosa TaxID=48698 RepID=A0A087XBN5_POEFO